MAHDVFISYSSKNKVPADEVCAAIEARGIPCWIAPRDITPGTEWSESIINALEECRVMVIIFSADSNQSPQVKREAERAVSKGVIILPVRIEDVYPSGAMEYYLSTSHWMDAVKPHIHHHLKNLVATVEALLAKGESAVPAEGLPVATNTIRRGSAQPARFVARADGEFPEELSGFNLGAFLLNRSWLASHHALPGFLASVILILPYVGLLLWLIFGAGMLKIALFCALGMIGWLWAGFRGNELAWEHRAWINSDHFRRVQQGWLLKGLTFWAVIAILSVALVKTGLNRTIANRVNAATAKVKKNPTITNLKKDVAAATGSKANKANKKPAPAKKPGKASQK